MTETQKQLRKENLIKNTKKLDDAGISYKSFNNGLHLKVGCFDYYPSTDTFIAPDGSKGFTAENLINMIRADKKNGTTYQFKDFKCIQTGDRSFKLAKEPIEILETHAMCTLPDWFDPKTSKIGIVYKQGIIEVDLIVSDLNKPAHKYDRFTGRWVEL